jgi:hypothetical protein
MDCSLCNVPLRCTGDGTSIIQRRIIAKQLIDRTWLKGGGGGLPLGHLAGVRVLAT